MPQNRPFDAPLFLRGALGGLIGALITFVALWKLKPISPLGIVVVPLLTVAVTTTLAFLYARRRTKP
jgi:hypothetical protein